MNYGISERYYPPQGGINLPLVHCTRDYQTILKILETGFRASYCRERLCSDLTAEELDLFDKEHFERYGGSYLQQGPRIPPGADLAASFPMVSFCCMLPTDAMTWMRSYGQYGIAMSPEWGIKHKLNPVHYLQQTSELSRQLFMSFLGLRYIQESRKDAALGHVDATCQTSLWIRQTIMSFAYSKNFYGPLVRNGQVHVNDYCFGLEREWRYVWLDGTVSPCFITESELKIDPELLKNSSSRLKNVVLPIELDLIEAIIVETAAQKESLESWFADNSSHSSMPRILINTTRHMGDFS